MSETELNSWSSRLPEWLAGTLDQDEVEELERALEHDPELRAEAELVRAIQAGRHEPPADLASKISSRLQEERLPSAGHARFATGWRLSSAAILILAMGTAVIWQNRFGPLPTFSGLSSVQAPLSDAWLLDDGVVAGGAVLDDLTTEELTLLLEEWER